MAENPKPGKWAGKSKNLTGRQQKKAVRVVGGGRTEKVKASERKAAKQEVSIGETKWQTKAEREGTGRGGLLVGADGKPVTGTVTLPGGKKVQYVRGKRTSVMPEKKAAPSGPRAPGKPAAPPAGKRTNRTAALDKAIDKRTGRTRDKGKEADKPQLGGGGTAAMDKQIKGLKGLGLEKLPQKVQRKIRGGAGGRTKPKGTGEMAKKKPRPRPINYQVPRGR